MEALKVQLQRKPRPFPTLTINREVESIDNFKFDDFVLNDYNPYPKIYMEMAVWKGYNIGIKNKHILIKRFIMYVEYIMETFFFFWK